MSHHQEPCKYQPLTLATVTVAMFIFNVGLFLTMWFVEGKKSTISMLQERKMPPPKVPKPYQKVEPRV